MNIQKNKMNGVKKVPYRVELLNDSWASLVAQLVKNPPAIQETPVLFWVEKIPWRRAWQPT